MIEWVSVSSKAIRKIGYDATSSRMFIDFEDSHPIYTFCGVPESVFHDFISSGSVGRYYHQYIKDRYQC
ncbi:MULTISPECIES: KTSC domain-containing protein [Gammaproteobacteria]|uniref:KTSC domain-containing protein n=1 Tax=Vreelandella malpeensis TaxID=1172368 RepID=A0ABS8DPT7_9GAMM|nr:KTSC domain-containing protein [Halomonas malpeensis]MCB8888301.1 KTSC domain-containing protein [Halomonas malpeensis]